MARRKTGYLSDGESSGDSDAGSDDAFDSQRKRQKRAGTGKEDALYGVFAQDDDGDDVRHLGSRRERTQRVDFTKAPAFTTASTSSAFAPQPLDNLSGEPSHDPVSAEASGSVPAAGKGFLGGAAVADDDDDDSSEDDDEDGGGGEGDSDDSSSEDDRRPASPRVRDAESDDEAAGMASFASKGKAREAVSGGLGFAPPSSSSEPGATASPSTGLAGPAAPKTSFFALPSLSSAAAPGPTDDLPSAFQPKPKQSRSFLPRSAEPTPPPPRAAADLSREDQQALHKMQGSFGARMLSKLGWSAGSGLGKEGEGIIAPIDVKLRPQKMGLGGVKERTDQSIREAIRKGDMPAPEEKKKAQPAGGKGGRRKGGAEREQPAGEPSSSGCPAGSEEWKRRKKLKSKVVHLTYDEILEQSGGGAVGVSAPGIGVIIDATGATPREISSLSHSQHAFGALPQTTARLPELRHNLRTIASQTVMALEALAKEGVAVRERRHRLALEEEALRRRVEAEAIQIARLQTLQTIIAEIAEISKTESAVRVSATGDGGIGRPRLEAFDPAVDRLVFEFGGEFDALGLDEVVVGAIGPAVKRLLIDWKPLEEDGVLPALWKWRKAFRLASAAGDDGTVDVYGRPAGAAASAGDDGREMTPYESLMWNVWLPRVRSAINNDWSPANASPAIYLYTTWSKLLPQFIKDNILDQLILPKLSKAVGEWKPRRDGAGPALSALVFPWLELLEAGAGGGGGRGKEVLEEGKRRMRGVVKGWRVGEDVPGELLSWKKVFSRSEWDSLLLKYVLPKLGSHLRTHLAINPRAQSLAPLEEALKWKDVLRSSMLSQLLEDEFVGKWLEVLYIWLVSPKPNFDEVTQWYSYWKTVFSEDVLALKGVQSGFRRGLDLMNQAMSLGPDAASQLQRPSLSAPLPPSPRSTRRSNGNGTSGKTHARRPDRQEEDEITFRSLAEAFVSDRDLIWAPTGRSDLNTGQVLFRVSRDGRTGGVVGYVSQDAFYVLEGGGLDGAAGVGKPVSLEEVVRRAQGGK